MSHHEAKNTWASQTVSALSFSFPASSCRLSFAVHLTRALHTGRKPKLTLRRGTTPASSAAAMGTLHLHPLASHTSLTHSHPTLASHTHIPHFPHTLTSHTSLTQSHPTLPSHTHIPHFPHTLTSHITLAHSHPTLSLHTHIPHFPHTLTSHVTLAHSHPTLPSHTHMAATLRMKSTMGASLTVGGYCGCSSIHVWHLCHTLASHTPLTHSHSTLPSHTHVAATLRVNSTVGASFTVGGYSGCSSRRQSTVALQP